MNSAETLIAALDQAAIALLEKSKGGDSVAAEGGVNASSETPSSLAEQVKAFQAVVEYAKIRPTLGPPQSKKESPLDGLKRQFSGEAVNRRGKRRSTEESADSGPDGGSADDLPAPAIAFDA
jgi:hypothetical protein